MNGGLGRLFGNPNPMVENSQSSLLTFEIDIPEADVYYPGSAITMSLSSSFGNFSISGDRVIDGLGHMGNRSIDGAAYIANSTINTGVGFCNGVKGFHRFWTTPGPPRPEFLTDPVTNYRYNTSTLSQRQVSTIYSNKILQQSTPIRTHLGGYIESGQITPGLFFFVYFGWMSFLFFGVVFYRILIPGATVADLWKQTKSHLQCMFLPKDYKKLIAQAQKRLLKFWDVYIDPATARQKHAWVRYNAWVAREGRFKVIFVIYGGRILSWLGRQLFNLVLLDYEKEEWDPEGVKELERIAERNEAMIEVMVDGETGETVLEEDIANQNNLIKKLKFKKDVDIQEIKAKNLHSSLAYQNFKLRKQLDKLAIDNREFHLQTVRDPRNHSIIDLKKKS